MTDARNFIFNTDYPLDKIIYLKSGSFIYAGVDVTIAHGLSFNPLVIGTWSLNSNFSTSREGGFIGFEGTNPNTGYITFGANGTNVIMRPYNIPNGTTVYYRIYGFMPSNVNVDAAATSSLYSSFILNTDYNYTKLWREGIAPTSGETVTHNLGYRPQVTAWRVGATGYIECVVSDAVPKVTTNTIIFPAFAYETHYRIYADGQL